MIPLRISVKNFLSYATQPNGAAYVFDFEGASLWSVAGRNGVGKSALFDVVTWTLFGEHRGGKSEDHRLVHQGALLGGATLEFSLGGRAYRVERSVSVKTKVTKRSASVRNETTGAWSQIPDTDRKTGFEAWATSLGLRYETFIASTLLLQGQSDKLILAAPKARFEVLAGALDLRAYEAIARRAHDLAQRLAGEATDAEAALGRAQPVTHAGVETAERDAHAAAERVAATEAARDAAVLGLEDAKRADRLATDLRAARERVIRLADTLADANRIEMDHRELLELDASTPILRAATNDLEVASTCDSEAASLDQRLEALDVGALEVAVSETTAAAERAASDLGGARTALAVAATELSATAAALIPVERYEDRERLVAEAMREAEEIESNMSDAERIFAELSEVEILRDATPIVEVVVAAERALSQRVADCAKVGSPADIAAARDRCRATVNDGTAKRDEAAAARDASRDAEAAAKERAKQAAQVLKTREAAAGEGRCSRCGQRVGKAHIEKELAEAKEEVESTMAAVRSARTTASDAAKTLVVADAELEAGEGELAALNDRHTAAVTAERERATAATAHERARTRIESARGAAGVVRELLSLSEEQRRPRLVRVRELPQLQRDATHARGELARATGVRQQIAKFEVELASLRATLPAAERDARRARQAAAKVAHGERAADVTRSEQLVADAERTRAVDARRYETALVAQRRLVGSAQSARAEAGAARARAEGALASLGRTMRDRLAGATAGDLLAACDMRRTELGDAAARWRSLEDARSQHIEAAAKVTALAGELELVPQEHRKPVAEWQRQSDAAQRDLTSAREEREQASRIAEDRRRDRDNFDALREAEALARSAARLANRLAELLGRTRLQARLVDDALRELERLANEMLTRTSAGQLEVRLSLKAAAGEEIVQIEAIDQATAGKPMEVAFMSGGQKFRIAVALAAAIGQYMGAPNSGRSLIVDEGFGSLDEAGRREMIAELQKVAPHMDRIIVVSHHEDFTSRDLFPSGFLIGRSGSMTTVERFL